MYNGAFVYIDMYMLFHIGLEFGGFNIICFVHILL